MFKRRAKENTGRYQPREYEHWEIKTCIVFRGDESLLRMFGRQGYEPVGIAAVYKDTYTVLLKRPKDKGLDKAMEEVTNSVNAYLETAEPEIQELYNFRRNEKDKA